MLASFVCVGPVGRHSTPAVSSIPSLDRVRQELSFPQQERGSIRSIRRAISTMQRLFEWKKIGRRRLIGASHLRTTHTERVEEVSQSYMEQ